MHVCTKRDFSEKGVHSFNQIFNGSCDIEKKKRINMIGVQFSSVTQSYPTLCDPMDCSTSGFPVHHQLPEFIQTRVHQVGDTIQPAHPLSAPSPAFNLSQHQGLFNGLVL